MNSKNIVRILAGAVIIIGLVVMIGWFADIDTLKRLVPSWVTMKFSTATSFLMSGIILALLNESRNNNSEMARVLLFAPLIIVLFFMATLLVSSISGTSTGVSQLFVKEDISSALGSLKAGTPSVGTIINFVTIIVVGFTYLISHVKHSKYITVSGGIVTILGVIALIGYATDIPELFYKVEGASGAMALHTAIAFVLIGVGLIAAARGNYVTGDIKQGRVTLKISWKLVFYFLISAIIPIMVIGAIAFDLAQSSLEKENFATINENADLQVERINAFFFERKADTNVMSKGIIFHREMPILNEYYKDTENPEYVDADDRLDVRLKVVRESYGYDNIMVANPEGDIVFVSKNDAKSTYLGKSMLEINEKTITEGKKGVYISEIIPDIGGDNQPELYTSAPLIDTEGNLAGVLIFDIQILEFLDELMKESYNGETGETGIGKKIGSEIVFLNNLRFDTDAALNRTIDVGSDVFLPMQFAASGEKGFGIYTDDRGVEVLAAWRHIPELNWGLVSKIDTAEAFAPIDQLQRDITVLGIVFAIGIGFFGVSASRTISKPLSKLKQLAEKISHGELDAKVTVQSSDEIGQLSQMMNDTGEKLKEVQKQKEEFVAMITHDLKQPLVPIQGNADLLKNPKMGELNEMQLDCVNEIKANAIKQLSMLDNLVSAQKLGLGAMEFASEEMTTKDVLSESIKTHSLIMGDKNINYFDSSEKDITIIGDRRRILETLTNIIQNAHDFVPENGTIEIGVKDGDGEVTFFVKDDGEGIPKEKQEKLFKRYGQVETEAQRKYGGTGLGLAVCKELTEGMGGKIWLESEVGKGTTFFFTIPKPK